MGREWSWGGRSTTTRRAEKETTAGCMSGVLQLFDFHQFQFPLHQPCFKPPNSFPQENPTTLKGAEAPRNSLESKEGSSMEGDLKLPMGIRLSTKVDKELSSETSTSPATKTPNLVARLMGLDLLPDSFSATLSCSSSSTFSSVHNSTRSGGKPNQDHHLEEKIACAALKRDLRSRRGRRILHCRSNSNINFKDGEVRYEMTMGSRSLPDTPRISSARRSADADPRLSLQFNKENLMILPEEILSRNSFSGSSYSTKSKNKEWKQRDENRSPSHHARQIVKQIKESVGRRKVGLDITNTIGGNGVKEGDSPTINSQKIKHRSSTKMGDDLNPNKLSTPSCSPRLRFLEPKNKPVTATSTSNDQSSHSPRPSPKPLQFSPPQPTPSPSQPSQADDQPQSKAPRKPKPQASNQHTITKCQKGSNSERFTQRTKREEAFVRATPATKANLSDKKCKKTPLSNNFVNIAAPSVVLLKKEQQDLPTSQKPVAQESKRSSQLSSCLSRKYNKQEGTAAISHQHYSNNNNTSNSISRNGGGAELRYVKGILLRTGIFRDSFISITRWFSSSHPLNPSIFHHLEHSYPYSKTKADDNDDEEVEVDDPGLLSHRCNRKLMFQLVDEILADEVRPYLNMKPWLRCIILGGFSPKNTQMTGLQLLERLWCRIQSFPAANCQILQDIDALIEKDLPEANMRTLLPYSEEGELVVFEIQHLILDSLLHETAAVFVE